MYSFVIFDSIELRPGHNKIHSICAILIFTLCENAYSAAPVASHSVISIHLVYSIHNSN